MIYGIVRTNYNRQNNECLKLKIKIINILYNSRKMYFICIVLIKVECYVMSTYVMYIYNTRVHETNLSGTISNSRHISIIRIKNP